MISLSARAAQTQPRAEGWAEFCHALHALVRESAITGVRRLNALGTAARLEDIFAAVAAAIGDDLSRLPGEVAAGEEKLAERPERMSGRLSLRRADLNALLWAEAAKRWDGPGGWALRAGGLGSLGLGAGAILLRRSPCLPPAPRRARSPRIRYSAPRASGALPIRPGSFPARASSRRVRRGALAGASAGSASDRRSGDPRHTARRRGPVAAGGRGGRGMAGLLDRDLPAAAERSVLRFFRLLLDLPVYGLAGWVVYRVAGGFFTGRYAGIDFLVNALLLLAAYLFPVRFVVRRGPGPPSPPPARGGHCSGSRGAALASRGRERRRPRRRRSPGRGAPAPRVTRKDLARRARRGFLTPAGRNRDGVSGAPPGAGVEVARLRPDAALPATSEGTGAERRADHDESSRCTRT